MPLDLLIETKPERRPSNKAPFKYPAVRRAGTKQPSRTDIIPFPIHPSQQPKDDVKITEAVEAYLLQKKTRLEMLITRACDAEDNEIYSFHPTLSREDVAVCYALLEGTEPPDGGRFGLNYYIDGDLVFNGTGDLVAGPFPTVFFDIEPNAMHSSLAPEIKLRERKIREFDFTVSEPA